MDRLGTPLGIVQKEKTVPTRKIPKRSQPRRERSGITIRNFFQAMYGLVSTKNKALSIKRA
jgi:hypothetical protein